MTRREPQMKFASLAAVLAVSVLVVAGCGGGGGGGPATGSSANAGRDRQVKFSQCMRENGIKDFPDPDSQGGIRINANSTSDLNPNNPQFKTAQKACQKYQPRASGSFDRANVQKMQAAALKYAQCMRAHGIDFPDPKFQNGGVQMSFGG